jgi:hypothetical protein
MDAQCFNQSHVRKNTWGTDPFLLSTKSTLDFVEELKPFIHTVVYNIKVHTIE